MSDLQKRMQSFEEKDGVAANADRVTVTGQGYSIEGAEETPFEGGNLTDFPIVLGSGSLIPGFEEQLIGKKAGDKVDVKVEFPADYHAAELAGKKSVFKLELNKVEAPAEQELNDEFAKQLGQESLESLKGIIKQGIQKDLDGAIKQRVKRRLFDHLDAENKFDIPESLVEREVAGLVQSQVQELSKQGMTPDQAGMNFDKIKEEMKGLGERRVKLGLLLAEIAKIQKIIITEDDLKQAVLEQIANAGTQADAAKKYFNEPQNRQQLAGPLLEEKVTTKLLADANIEEKEIEPKELMKEFE